MLWFENLDCLKIIHLFRRICHRRYNVKIITSSAVDQKSLLQKKNPNPKHNKREVMKIAL